jgi:hypothetical protein
MISRNIPHECLKERMGQIGIDRQEFNKTGKDQKKRAEPEGS